MIAMQKPLLPRAESYARYLAMIDEGRWYTNSGPLLHLYEERLAELFKCYVVACSSGTAGLTAAISALRMEKGNLTVPAWTFVATANACRSGGGEPYFIDVDNDTWQGQGHIATAPFGSPSLTCREFVIDAAAAFDVYASGRSKVGPVPVVISTHATKCFSTAEGGLVLTTDRALAQRVRELINHGMSLTREVPRAGFNGKLSEYHAAIGLASLDSWVATRMAWFEIKRKYLDIFGELAGGTPLASLDWVGPAFAVRLEGRTIDGVMDELYAKGIMSRRVWGRGVHRYEAYRDTPRSSLPVTEKLADEVLFLPYQVDMPEHNIVKIKDALVEALREKDREPNYWGV